MHRCRCPTLSIAYMQHRGSVASLPPVLSSARLACYGSWCLPVQLQCALLVLSILRTGWPAVCETFLQHMHPQLCGMLFNTKQVRVEASAGHDVSPARHDQPLKVATCCRHSLSNDSTTDSNTIANAQAVPRAGVPATAAAAMQG
jgi:hypothetical protein